MTTRGLGAADFEEVAEQLHLALELALEIQQRSGPKLVDFVAAMEAEPKVAALRERVQSFASGFYMP